MATPRITKAFNFYRYGLTSENFAGVLAIGSIRCLGALVMFGVAFGQHQGQDRRKRREK